MYKPNLIHVQQSNYKKQRDYTVKIIISICIAGVVTLLVCPLI